MLDAIRYDLKLGLRSLSRQPVFSLVVIVTLALGIGATTAIFTLVDELLLEPLPYESPEDLVVVWQNDRLTGTEREPVSVPDYFDFKQRGRFFDGVAGFALGAANFQRPGAEPERVQIVRATHDLSDVLGARLVLGRSITAEEDQPGGPRVALLTESFWQSAFGRDPDVVGETLRLDDDQYSVIGVLEGDPELPDADPALWTPLQQTADTSPRWNHGFLALARLAPGAPIESAQADMTSLSEELEAEYSTNANRGAFVEPLEQVLRGQIRPAVLLLFGSVLGVLLIACANLANLLLARGASRQQEIAICAALGADARRLSRRFLIESALLTLAGSVLGLGVALAGLRGLLRLAPDELADRPIALQLPALLFALGLSIAIAIAFGLLPTLQALRTGIQGILRGGPSRGKGGGFRWTGGLSPRQLLVIAQVAVTLVLLCGASVMIGSLRKLQRVDAGFSTSGVLRADFQLPSSRYPSDFSNYPHWVEINSFNRALLDQVSALPGVETSAITTNHPLDQGFTNSFIIVGREAESSELGELKTRIVSHGYFPTNGVRLVAGRFFTPTDTTESQPVMLINEATVRRYFPNGSPLGQRIAFWGIEREIVGVVANERMHGLDQQAPPAMYVALPQAPQRAAATLMVRASVEPLSLIDGVRAAVSSIDPTIAAFNVATMDQTLQQSVGRRRFVSVLLTVFSAVAVFLAVLGIHGVLSYLVAQRRREVGVRVALGATRSQILALILRQGLLLAGVGVVIGLIAARLLSSWLRSLVFEVSPADPWIYGLVALGLLVVALAACAFPARRASTVDPVRALQQS